MRLVLAGLLSALALSSCATTAPTTNAGGCAVAGNYVINGQTPNGGAYAGTARISASGGQCLVVWAPPNASSGTGGYANGQLMVNFVLAGRSGVAQYTRQSDGSLSGSWWLNEAPGSRGSETMTPSR